MIKGLLPEQQYGPQTTVHEMIAWANALWKCFYDEKQQDRQCMYNILMRRVRVTILTLEK